jgi:hypothetical protein
MSPEAYNLHLSCYLPLKISLLLSTLTFTYLFTAVATSTKLEHEKMGPYYCSGSSYRVTNYPAGALMHPLQVQHT